MSWGRGNANQTVRSLSRIFSRPSDGIQNMQHPMSKPAHRRRERSAQHAHGTMCNVRRSFRFAAVRVAEGDVFRPMRAAVGRVEAKQASNAFVCYLQQGIQLRPLPTQGAGWRHVLFKSVHAQPKRREQAPEGNQRKRRNPVSPAARGLQFLQNEAQRAEVEVDATMGRPEKDRVVLCRSTAVGVGYRCIVRRGPHRSVAEQAGVRVALGRKSAVVARYRQSTEVQQYVARQTLILT